MELGSEFVHFSGFPDSGRQLATQNLLCDSCVRSKQVLELTERQHAHITSEASFCSQTGWSVSASACLIRLLISFNRCNAEPSFALKKFYFSAFRKSSYA